MSTSATVVTTASSTAATPLWKNPLVPGSALVRDFVPPSAAARSTAAEREAYDRGFTDGQRRTVEQQQAAVNAQVSRLSSAVSELASLRPGVLQRANHDVVTLALVLTKSIVRREIRLDPGLILELGSAAAARLNEGGVATIEVSPDLYNALMDAGRASDSGPVSLVENPKFPAGTCLVRAASGAVNLSLDAQIQELFDALLESAGDDATS